MPQPLALIIDDEPDIRELLELTLTRMDISTHAAENISQGKRLLNQHAFDVCLTDMKLPDGDGLELVEYIQQTFPSLPTAVITAHGNMESAINALKFGAFDFVSKPVDLQMLRNLISTALKLSKQHNITSPKNAPLTLLGDSPAIHETRSTIVKLARSQAPVYISGESGTGKELVARLIHEQGPRAEQSFIPVNCGAIPDNLMESEFFGHKKGSFTGAGSDKTGLFQAANGGTLFLDEVADLPLHMQVKLLRAIQEKAVRPVGAQKEMAVDTRILCATHKNLAELVKEGSFRQDLYYRINVIELHVPSLHERNSDIPLLAEHFLNKLAQETHSTLPQLDSDAVNALNTYDFPGNVRELENILERAMTLCENNTITSSDLQLKSPLCSKEKISLAETAPRDEISTSSIGQNNPLLDNLDELESVLVNTEKQAIVKALQQTRYNKTAAAKLLGISFRALRYRLKKYSIQ